MVCLWLEFGQQYRTHFVTGLCISEPIFYGDLVYKFKRIVRKSNFSDQFKKIVKRYVRVGYYWRLVRVRELEKNTLCVRPLVELGKNIEYALCGWPLVRVIATVCIPCSNPITVYSYGNHKLIARRLGQASDSMTALT